MAGVAVASRAPSRTPATSTPRRRDVQGLRAVAVLMVVGFHAGLPLPGGFVGVDVFFVISGFVITAMLAREWVATGRILFRRFYVRRFQRLAPALAAMVSLTMVASSLFLSPVGPQQVATETGIGAMLLVANLVIAATTGGYFDHAAELNPLLHTWSLSVEEQFYLVFPLILACGWAAAARARRTWFGPGFLVAVVGLASFSLAVGPSLSADLPGLDPSLVGFYSPLTRVWEFAAGAALALLSARRQAPSVRTSRVAGIAGAVLIASSVWAITTRTTFPGLATLLPVVGSLLVIHAGGKPANPVSRFLSCSPMVRIGDWSYSIYLWHWPFIAFAGLLWPGRPLALILAAAGSLVPALMSYRWVEQPIRRMHFSRSPGTRAIVAGTLVTPLLLAGTVRVAVANGYWNHEVQAFQTSKRTHPAADCAPGADAFCHWNSEASGLPVYLVGDSHAGHFGTAVIDAAGSHGQPVALSMAYSCPFAPGLDIAPVGERSDCHAHNARVLETLSTAGPGAVVIAGADTYWVGDGWAVSDAGRTPSVGIGAKLRTWEHALTRTVATLQDAGHAVVLVQTVPLHQRYDPARCSTVEIRTRGCSDVLPESEALRAQGDARTVVERVARRTHITVLDPWDFFCREGECTTTDGSRSLYMNWSHMSVAGSQALAAQFEAALRGSRLSAG